MPIIDLDIRTLSFVTTSITSFFAVGLFAYSAIQKEFRGFWLFASAVASYAAGHLLLGYRYVLPDYISIILANLLIIAGIIFYYEGLRQFLEHSSSTHIISIIIFIAGIVLFIYFTYLTPSVNNRIIIIVSIHVFFSALCVRELNRDLHTSWRLPRMATALVFVFYCLFQLYRLMWTLGESPIQSFMAAGTVHAFAFISVIFLTTGSTFGFIWMVSKLDFIHLLCMI